MGLELHPIWRITSCCSASSSLHYLEAHDNRREFSSKNNMHECNDPCIRFLVNQYMKTLECPTTG